MKKNLYNTQKMKSQKRAACGDLLARGKGLRMWSDNLLTEESH